MKTQSADISALKLFLQNMWQDYCHMTPEAHSIYKTLTQNGETIQNDHIALRTFNHPKLGIKSLAQHFTKYGYIEKGEYFFTEKKLYAKHYEHPHSDLPKIFISELELDKVSAFVRETMNALVENISEQNIDHENFVFGGKYWNTFFSTYEKLALESEYASWVYAYGFRPNHFTVSINHLKNFKDIQKLNVFIKDRGYKLNASGGEIKGTPAELLEQSSTMAKAALVQFADGIYSIPACYYEFAKRYPMSNGELYQGFIAKSADKIFESTHKQ
jgi:hypothetical protein